MTKMYKKEECEFIGGRILHGDEIVAMDKTVFDMLHAMELAAQEADYILSQPKATEAPSLKGFKQESCYDKPSVIPETPLMDKEVERAMAIMAEADRASTDNRLNALLISYEPMFMWVNDEYVVDEPGGTLERFDLPRLGNPLELTEARLVSALAAAASADGHAKGEGVLGYGLEPIVGGE